MITRAIENAFKRGREKKWDKLYWAIDIHETIIRPNYDKPGIPTVWYPFAKRALKIVSKRNDIDLILYTCSWDKEIQEYLEMFKEDGIEFKYVNKNPDIKNTAYGNYRYKPYFNVLFEDKSGFDPLEWPYVIELLNTYPDGYCLMSDEDIKKHYLTIKTHRENGKKL